ncbi:MAG: methionine--tRNA ligase [Spirochaetales bacterium]|nr:methionine--tRNA ligase [Spirochaetales bacterium]
MKKVITSALIYANGPLHLGHLVEYIQTDIYSRSCKLQKQDAIYVCADDTHGTPIEINAMQMKITPEQLIDKFHKEHKEDFDKFFVAFDEYYTTNGTKNKEVVELIYKKVKENGYIYEKEIEATYCEHCKRFLPDRFVKGTCPICGAENQYGDTCEKCNSTYKPQDLRNSYCIVCGNTPILKKSKHFFFKLSALKDQIIEYFKRTKFQEEIKNYLLNWLNEGLKDWDISRDGPYFGFKIPDSDQYFYVWFDAPIGYIGSTKEYCDKNNLDWKDYWISKDSEIYHFIGKDIIYFHFLFWPAVLIAADFALPKHIQVHGFLNVNGQKMSKSRGTFITAKDFIERGGDPQYLRYYYAALLGNSINDFDFNDNDYRTIINSNLIGKFGNLVNRLSTFLLKNFDGKTDEDIEDIYNQFSLLKENYFDLLNNLEYRKAIELFQKYTDTANKYFQDNQPWQLLKTDKNKTLTILTTTLSMIKDLAICLYPIIPQYCEEIATQLNFIIDIDNIGKPLLNHKINSSNIIFKKIEDNFTIIKKPAISEVQIVAGKILEVDDHPNADKLYVLKIDIGSDIRTVVAGIKPYYTKDELINKNICLVANLKPANLKGIFSNGMILAASSKDGKVGVLTHNQKPGTKVVFENVDYPDSFEQISIDKFKELEIVSSGDNVFCFDNCLICGNEKVFADKKIAGKVS